MIDTSTATLDLQVAAAAHELLGWVLADHIAAVPLAKVEGIDAHVFTDDLRIIWTAADLAAEHDVDRDCMFRLIENGLKSMHFWDESQSALSTGCLWSTARLLTVYEGYFPSTVAVRSHARRVMELDRRRRRAEALAVELAGVLEGQDAGEAPGRSNPVAVVLMPARGCA